MSKGARLTSASKAVIRMTAASGFCQKNQPAISPGLAWASMILTTDRLLAIMIGTRMEMPMLSS